MAQAHLNVVDRIGALLEDGVEDRVVNARALVREAEDVLQEEVAAARRLGTTWGEIGRRLGVSRQAAQKRFG